MNKYLVFLDGMVTMFWVIVSMVTFGAEELVINHRVVPTYIKVIILIVGLTIVIGKVTKLISK